MIEAQSSAVWIDISVEFRLSFFEECVDTFSEVRGLAGGGHQRLFKSELTLEEGRVLGVEKLFGAPSADR